MAARPAQNPPANDKLVFSFFAGAGFLDLGFEKSGFRTAFVNEVHEPFLKMYKHARVKLNIPEPVFGYSLRDITDFKKGEGKKFLSEKVRAARQNGSLVGFIGGPPCPDFSVCGKNLGSDGENGRLSGVYVSIITQQQPDFFVFENVKGLWKTGKHRNFYFKLRNKLRRSGYMTTERLVNALEYGVPQDRQRLILVGFKKDMIAPDVFLNVRKQRDISAADGPWVKHITHSIETIHAAGWPKSTPFQPGETPHKPPKILEDLSVEHWFRKNQVKSHANAGDFFTPHSNRFSTVPEGNSGGKSFKRLHRWRYSPTACYGNNEVHLHPYEKRRLSVAEVLAIQSLPREFELPADVPLSTKFKTVGNGVPFLAAKAIAAMVRDILEPQMVEAD